MLPFQNEVPESEVPAESLLARLPEWLEGQLGGLGLGAATPWASRILIALAVVLVAVAAHFIARRVIVRLLQYLVRKTRTKWDDALADNRVFLRLAHLVPAFVLYFGAPLIFSAPDEEGLRSFIQRVSLAYMVLIGGMAASAFLSSAAQVYESTFKAARERPIRSYIQVVRIFIWIFVAVLVVATLLDQSPWAFVGGMGAMTAILLLVFKDSILGFVASIQIAGLDLLRVGDWIEMPKYGADGDVVEISLTTVKVQNWDKTITSLPTYSLVSDAFKNWRGMSESGGRRIKRAILLDQNSVRFVDREMLERFRRIQYIQEYLDAKVRELEAWNEERGVDSVTLVNGRHLTNLGTFRAYVEAYLKHHPMIHEERMTFLVRQLAPTEKGLPLEIYVFSKEQRWVQYEAIQADIFDHILAAVPEFDLQLAQIPTGTDLRSLAGAPAG